MRSVAAVPDNFSPAVMIADGGMLGSPTRFRLKPGVAVSSGKLLRRDADLADAVGALPPSCSGAQPSVALARESSNPDTPEPAAALDGEGGGGLAERSLQRGVAAECWPNTNP